jgi:hypothetical protein
VTPIVLSNFIYRSSDGHDGVLTSWFSRDDVI